VIASPCINICQMHAQTGLCVGCYRTLDEIARWAAIDESERAQILALVAERKDELGPLRRPRPR